MINKIKSITRGQLLLVIFLLLVVGGIVLGINLASNKSYENYKEFEKELIKDAKNYVEIYDITIDRGGEKVIKLSSLKKNNLVSNDLKDKCHGYVRVDNDDLESDEYTFYSYIRCGNKYNTSGYDFSID